MTPGRCEREDELLDAVGRGYIHAELTEHAASCAACSELRLIAGALLDDRHQAMAEAPVPSAATMWWRIQMRRQQEAQAAARKSLLVGQAITLLVAVALVAALFGTDARIGVAHLVTSIRVSTPLLIAVGTWLLLAPIAGYVAIRQK